MEKQFVRIEVDLFVKWETHPPMYRLYCNEELMSERNYSYSGNMYISENLQLFPEKGKYKLRIESPTPYDFKLRNLRCTAGKKVVIIDNENFEVG